MLERYNLSTNIQHLPTSITALMYAKRILEHTGLKADVKDYILRTRKNGYTTLDLMQSFMANEFEGYNGDFSDENNATYHHQLKDYNWKGFYIIALKKYGYIFMNNNKYYSNINLENYTVGCYFKILNKN